MVSNPRFIALCAIGLLVALNLGCTTDHRRQTHPLPALPAGELDARSPAVVQTSTLNGADANDFSAGAQIVGSGIELSAAAGELEWALWRFTPAAGTTLQSVAFNFTVSSGSGVWIGVADYVQDRWQLEGPHPPAGTAVIAPLSAGNISPGGNVFFLVAAFEAKTVSVSKIDVEIDVPVQQMYFIEGKLTHNTLSVGISGQTIVLEPSSLQTVTDENGEYLFPDLQPGNYSVIPPELDGVTVSPPFSEVTIIDSNIANVDFTASPPDEQITYKTHIKFLFDAKCVECHGPGQQHGDPPTRLDAYLRPDNNDAWHNAEAALEQVTQGICPYPPKMQLTLGEKQLIEDWINIFEKREEPLP